MPMSLDEFSAQLEAVVKRQVERVGRIRDEFHTDLEAFLVAAKGDAKDLTQDHATLFEAAMARMQKLIEEL